MPPNEPELTTRLFSDGDASALDPLALFDLWLAEAEKTEPADANAMTLATAGEGGMPDARIVLLKVRDEGGFSFFTNLDSDKGRQLERNPNAALLFHWKSLTRQVRVRGPVAHVPAAAADAYFASRPHGSQVGAHASDQSRPLASRAALLIRMQEFEKRFAAQKVPRPPRWLGYTLTPLRIEFWRASDFRLHDRVAFTRPGPAAPWTRSRLYP
ncbi:MAG: pyridoxamine 5'-phosphate oxidase [Cucumibacter sp.]